MRAQMLQRARDAYARRRWAEAYRGFHAAHEHADLDAQDLAAFGDAAWWLGHNAESLALCDRAHRLHLQAGDVPRAAQMAIELGFLWFLRGDPTIGSGWITRAARLLSDVPECAVHGYLLYLEAEEATARGEFDLAIELTHRMQQLAERHGDDTLCAVALVLQGTAIVKQGRVDEGLSALDEAMLSVYAGAVAPSWAGNLYCHVMGLCFELVDPRRARAWTNATERWCDRQRNAAMFLGICRLHRAQLLHLEGAWGDAERQATQACRDLADMNVGVVAEGHYEIAELHRLRGALTEADQQYARSHELGRDPQPGLALLRLAQGRTEVAEVALRTALDATAQPLDRVPLLMAQVEVADARADTQLAGEAADELTAIADRFASPGLVAAERHAAGTAQLIGDEPERAIPLLRDAHRRWRALEARYDAARVRVRLARALRAVGDTEAAARELDTATAVFRELGADHDLSLLGGPGPPDAPPGGLSAREVEVLVQVAAGRTNRQIAGALTISERTVERHVSNIFTKLDVTSRTAAARVAFAHGLVDAGGR